MGRASNSSWAITKEGLIQSVPPASMLAFSSLTTVLSFSFSVLESFVLFFLAIALASWLAFVSFLMVARTSIYFSMVAL
jgi:hypothetical protein